MNLALLSCLSVKIGWVLRHAWQPGDAILSLNSPCHRLWWVLEGVVEVRLRDADDDRLREVAAGEAVLLPRGVPRNIRTPRSAIWLSVDITATLPGRVDLLATLRPPRVWRPSETAWDAMTALLLYLEGEERGAERRSWRPGGVHDIATQRAWRVGNPEPTRASDPSLLAFRDSIGTVLFGLCWRSLSEEQDLTDLLRGGDSPPWLGAVLELIGRTPDIGLSELATAVELTPVQLRRGFHRWLGMAPQEYLLRARLDAACRLLETTEGSIARIAEKVGFESLSYFSRRFKETFGHTPGRHRRIFSETADAPEGVRREQKAVS